MFYVQSKEQKSLGTSLCQIRYAVQVASVTPSKISSCTIKIEQSASIRACEQQISCRGRYDGATHCLVDVKKKKKRKKEDELYSRLLDNASN